MKNNSLVAGRWSLVAGLISLCFAITVNAQSISSAQQAAPSNCDTGCAQSTLVTVAGSNSASDGTKVIYEGVLPSGGYTFTVSKRAYVSISATASYSGYTTDIYVQTQLSGPGGNAMSTCNQTQGSSTSESGSITFYITATGSCVVPAGTYTARGYRHSNSLAGKLQVIELP